MRGGRRGRAARCARARWRSSGGGWRPPGRSRGGEGCAWGGGPRGCEGGWRGRFRIQERSSHTLLPEDRGFCRYAWRTERGAQPVSRGVMWRTASGRACWTGMSYQPHHRICDAPRGGVTLPTVTRVEGRSHTPAGAGARPGCSSSGAQGAEQLWDTSERVCSSAVWFCVCSGVCFRSVWSEPPVFFGRSHVAQDTRADSACGDVCVTGPVSIPTLSGQLGMGEAPS